MFLSSRAGIERAEISTLAGLRIFLSRIEAILASLQLSNHNDKLLHCHRLCQISRLIYIATTANGDVVSKKLQRNDREDG